MLYQNFFSATGFDPSCTSSKAHPGMRELGPDIGKRLRQAREAAGLTVRDLAYRAHTTKTTIMAISDGRGGNSSVSLLARIARALNVSPAWLAYGEGEGPQEPEQNEAARLLGMEGLGGGGGAAGADHPHR